MMTSALIWNQPHPDVYHIPPAPTASVGRYEPAVSGELIILRH